MQYGLIALGSIALFTSLTTAAPAKQAATKIRIQLNGVDPFSEDAIQRSIPTNGSFFSISVLRAIFSA